MLKKRPLLLALLASLQPFCSSFAQPQVPSYWQAKALFSPNSPIQPGYGSGVTIRSDFITTTSGGSITIINTLPPFIINGPGITIGTLIPNIDSSQPFFPISQVGTLFAPRFDGGTLRVDVGGTYANDFTLTGLGGIIDTYGQSATLTGVFSDDTQGIPGSLTIQNSLTGGALGLAGVNTYTGSTTINPGASVALVGAGSIADSSKLQNDGSFDISGTAEGASLKTLTGSGSVSLGGKTLTLTQATPYDSFAGTITGGGGLVIAGGTFNLNNAASYSGATTIQSGANLNLNGAGSISNSAELFNQGTFNIDGANGDVALRSLAGNGSVNLGSHSLSLTQASGLFSGRITGSGGLLIAGGSETLSNAGNSYTGPTQINNGATLALLGAGSISSSHSVLVNGTLDTSATELVAPLNNLSGSGLVNFGNRSLSLFNSSSTLYSGQFTGSGNVIVASGSMVWTGDQTYTGLTQIAAGSSLQLGDGGNSGNITGNIYNAGTLIFKRADAASYGGVISGSGNFAQTGSGVLTLTGANTYTGLTSINIGTTLALSGSGSLAASQRLDNLGVFDIANANGEVSLQNLVGNGTVNLGTQNLRLTGNLVDNSSDINTFTGSINGTGGVVITGLGSRFFTGENTYTGGTTINAGAQLILGNGGNSGSVVGNINNQGNLVFNRGNSQDFTGVISGAGKLIQSGGGVLTLSAVETYSGQTIIKGGTLALTGSGAIAQSEGVANAGIFSIAGAQAGATIQTLSGYGGVDLGSKTLTLSNAKDAFSGTFTGTGGLTVAAGSETLDGLIIHQYGGLTTINPGATLSLKGSGIIDNQTGVLANGTFDVSGLTAYSAYVAGISGSGIVNLGSNTLFLGHAAGDFSGSIQGNTTGNNLGLVVLNGQQSLSGSNIYTGLTGIDNGAVLALQGAGNLEHSAGLGLVVGSRFDISAANGPVTLQNLFSVASSLVSAPSSIQLGANQLVVTQAGQSQPYDPFYAGIISGTGGLTISSGTLVLTGNSNYTGTTVINQGATLQLGNGGTSGSIVSNVLDDGSLLFNHSDDVTFAGDITGSGSFKNIGTGKLNLTGNVQLGNGTTIEQGIFSVNGSMSGPLTVATEGILRGSGVLNGPLTVSGTLAPGNSPGTLTANSTVTMTAQSTYQEDIDGLGTGNGAGNYSRLLINGSQSQFIANGTLQPLLRGISGNAHNNFTPRLGDGFQIVSAQGGIVGRFDQVLQPSSGMAAGTQLDVFYNAYDNHSIVLYTTPVSYTNLLASTGANLNSLNVGRALDRLRQLDNQGLANTRQNDLRYSVAGFNAQQIPLTTLGLAGEIHGAMAAAAPEAGRWLQSSVARHLAFSGGWEEPAGISAGDNLWVDFNASQGHANGDQYANGYSFSRYQFALGADVIHSQANRLGLGVTYSSTAINPNSGSGQINETAPFLYGQYGFGKTQKLILDGLVSYGFSSWQTDRADPIRRVPKLHSDTAGNSALFSVGLRSPWQLDGWVVEPFARVLWQNNNRRQTSEGWLSPSALVLTDYSMNGTRVLAGAAIGSAQSDPLATAFTYRASLAFGNDFGNLVHPSVNAILAGESLNIQSPHVGRQFGQLSLNATYKVIDQAYAYVGVMGEARGDRLEGGVNAGFNYKF